MYDWAAFHHFKYLPAILKQQRFAVAAEEPQSLRPKLIVQVWLSKWLVPVQLFSRMKNGRIRAAEARITLTPLARSHLDVPS
jgi:hypothetical protein